MNQIYFLFKNQLITALFCSLIAVTTAIITTPEFQIPEFSVLNKSCKVVIIIPAYNEEQRIAKTLHAYLDYFTHLEKVSATFLVVCNNCTDKTVEICKNIQKKHAELHIMDLPQKGKGFAIKQGFLKALDFHIADYIGFVDADMATTPPYFYELITKIKDYDGAIASRYTTGARVWPNRPFIKRIGGQFYNWVLRRNFHLDIRDTQCGAKLFTYQTIQMVAPHMQETGWAWDLEFLYICQLFDKNIIEVPTTWTDVPGSHLSISRCYKEFLSSPARIKQNQKQLAQKLKHQKDLEKHALRQKNRAKKRLQQDPVFLASK